MQQQLSAKKMEVEQLRVEARIERKRVSECVQDIIDFSEANKKDDPLVHGFSNQRENPFRKKSSFESCSLL